MGLPHIYSKSDLINLFKTLARVAAKIVDSLSTSIDLEQSPMNLHILKLKSLDTERLLAAVSSSVVTWA